MASYANKAALKAQLLRLIGRELNTDPDDLDLTDDDLNRFVRDCETKANRLLRLRDDQCVSSAAITADSQYAALPTDYAGLSMLRWTDANGTQTQLKYVDHDVAQARSQECRTSGTPEFYTIVKDKFWLIPTPNAAGTLGMFVKERFELVDDADTNALLEDNSDIYLHGAAAEAFDHLGDDERAPNQRGLFLEGVRELRISDWHDRRGGQLGEGAEHY